MIDAKDEQIRELEAEVRSNEEAIAMVSDVRRAAGVVITRCDGLTQHLRDREHVNR